MTGYLLITSISTAGLFITAVFTLFYIYKQLEIARKSVGAQFTHRWEEMALRTSFLSSREVIDARVCLIKHLGQVVEEGEVIPYERLEAAMQETPEIYVYIRVILGHIERIAIACRVNIFDEEVAYYLVSYSCIQFYTTYSEFIDKRREISPLYLKEAADLINKWQKKRSTTVHDLKQRP